MSVQNYNYPADLKRGGDKAKWCIVLVDFPHLEFFSDTIKQAIEGAAKLLGAEIIESKRAGVRIPVPSQKKALQFTISPMR